MTLNTSKLIKGVCGISCATGLGFGGYYGFQFLNSKEKGTISQKLIKDGYIQFKFEVGEWLKKFNNFKNNDETTQKLKEALREAKPTLVVEKNTQNNEGGKELKEWCENLLAMKEVDAVNGHKTLENAKLFCAELKTTPPPKARS